MPTQDLNDLDAEQTRRLENLTKTKNLANDNAETTTLLLEVGHDYARTMNKIIFDKYLEENENNAISNIEIFPITLELPQNDEEKEVYKIY